MRFCLDATLQSHEPTKERHDRTNEHRDAVGLGNELDADETTMADLNERMLTGVATKFGKNSSEYEQAGGTKKSERKPPKRKPKPAT